MSKDMNIKEVVQIAKGVLQKQGYHMMQVLAMLPSGNGAQIVIDTDKDLGRKLLRKFVQEKKVTRYFHISEAWMGKMKPGEKFVRPSQAKDKEDILMICEFRDDLTSEIRIYPFYRKEDKIHFKKRLKINSSFTSMWNVYLEEDGLAEKMEKKIESTEEKEI